MNTVPYLPESVGRIHHTSNKHDAIREARTLIREMVRQFELSAAEAEHALTLSVLEDHGLGEPAEGHEWVAEYRVQQQVDRDSLGGLLPKVLVGTTWTQQEADYPRKDNDAK